MPNKSFIIASINLIFIVFSIIGLGVYFAAELQKMEMFWGSLVLSLFVILNSHLFHKEGIVDGKIIAKL